MILKCIILLIVLINLFTELVCRIYAEDVRALSHIYCAFSVSWAWGVRDDLLGASGYHETDPVILSTQQNPRMILFNYPWNNLTILAIIVYQKSNRNIGCRLCAMTPNCSNFAIGLLRRHGLIYTTLRTKSRIEACGKITGFHL